MADNKLELVVEVDVNKANASIKTLNAGLSSIESTATKTARGASHGIDGLTASMVKGATAGNLLAEGIKKAIEWAKEWTIEAAKAAAHDSRMEASTRALAKAHGVSAEAMEKAADAVRKVGFHFEDGLPGRIRSSPTYQSSTSRLCCASRCSRDSPPRRHLLPPLGGLYGNRLLQSHAD